MTSWSVALWRTVGLLSCPVCNCIAVYYRPISEEKSTNNTIISQQIKDNFFCEENNVQFNIRYKSAILRHLLVSMQAVIVYCPESFWGHEKTFDVVIGGCILPAPRPKSSELKT